MGGGGTDASPEGPATTGATQASAATSTTCRMALAPNVRWSAEGRWGRGGPMFRGMVAEVSTNPEGVIARDPAFPISDTRRAPSFPRFAS